MTLSHISGVACGVTVQVELLNQIQSLSLLATYCFYLLLYIYIFTPCARSACMVTRTARRSWFSPAMCALGVKLGSSDLSTRAFVCWAHLTGSALYHILVETPELLSFSFWNSLLLLYIVSSFLKHWPFALLSWSEPVTSGSFQAI